MAPAAGAGATPAPLTPDGMAAVVADHIDRSPKRVEQWDVTTRELGVDAPGVVPRLQQAGHASVAVAPTTDSSLVCGDDTSFDECVDLGDDGAGGRVVLGWQELEPEEDPGVVFVIDRRDGEDVLAKYYGDLDHRRPARLDLGVSVDQMAEIVTDERLTLAGTE